LVSKTWRGTTRHSRRCNGTNGNGKEEENLKRRVYLEDVSVYVKDSIKIDLKNPMGNYGLDSSVSD
jgi:hypothetical protein